MKKSVRIIALIMALLMLSTVLLSCKKKKEGGGETTGGGVLIGDDSLAAEKYKDVDFGGKKLIVHINTISEQGYDSSSRYIKTPATLGDANGSVEEEVFKRDIWMKENLNMDVEYIDCSVSYASTVKSLEPLLLAGDQGIDLYINQLFPMANLSLRGYFANVANRAEINYFENYWYNDFMTSLSLDDGNSMYLLAGDYFMDVIQSTNIMVTNTAVLNDRFVDKGGSTAFLDTVINGGWTYEVMYEYMQGVYVDGMDMNDATYGYVVDQVWQNMIPMVVSADLDYVEYSGGQLKSVLNSTRASDLYDWMSKIFRDRSITPMTQDGTKFESQLNIKNATQLLASGKGLFGSARFAYMPKFAELDAQYSVIPYPKLEVTDSYCTPAHDTTEIGAIPNSCTDTSTVLQMLEIFCERTNATVMDRYYNDGLKLMYSADTRVSQIVDIVHDSMGSGFALAYNDICANALLWKAFYEPFCNKQSFVTNYEGIDTMINSALKGMLKQWNAIEQ